MAEARTAAERLDYLLVFSMEISYHLSNSWLGKIMMSESSNLHMKILSQHQRIYFSILVFQLTQSAKRRLETYCILIMTRLPQNSQTLHSTSLTHPLPTYNYCS